MKSMMRAALIAATVAALTAFAQDEFFDSDDVGASGADSSEGAEMSEDGGEEAAAGEVGGGEAAAPARGKRLFTPLPFCSLLEGVGEVKKPGGAWESVSEGKFYPLGSMFRTTDKSSRMVIQFGGTFAGAIDPAAKESDAPKVEIRYGAACFGTIPQPIGSTKREISLQSGIITVKMPGNMPEGSFSISAPGFTAVNPKGESRYYYEKTADGEVAVVRCVTRSLSVKGRHFEFPELKAANEFKIRTSQDQLFTGLYGKSGDCAVRLDQGQKKVIKDFRTGESEIVSKPLVWKLTPKTAVRIYRAKPDLAKDMSVTVMTFNANGTMCNRCAFTENRPEINTGELVLAPAKADNQAKRVAEEAAATETVDVDVEDDDGAGEDAGDSGAGDSGTGDSGGGDEMDDMDF